MKSAHGLWLRRRRHRSTANQISWIENSFSVLFFMAAQMTRAEQPVGVESTEGSFPSQGTTWMLGEEKIID